jgi:hypothetical protein
MQYSGGIARAMPRRRKSIYAENKENLKRNYSLY